MYILVFIFVCCPNLTAFNETKAYGQIEEPEATETIKKEKIKALALIPFTSKSGIAETKPEEEITTNERFLTVSLYDALIRETGRIKITPLQESEAAYAQIKSEKEFSYYRDIAVSAGKKLNVDAVMTGVISEYREREGSELGVESPASVAFSVQVLDAEDGTILWETYFTETQKSLLENLFEIDKFFKRGGKWITADELAKEGARKAASEFNQYLLTEN
ncbi:MAG: hypothetical protein RIG61_00355 [Deltaproteobacteria bacterium]